MIAGLVPESATLPDRLGRAIYDAQRIYRYRLSRVWDASGPRVCWILLNPSTANAEVDDRTIARVTAFSKAWGHGSLTVVNLFAMRASRPMTLTRVEDPVGPYNDGMILEAASSAASVIAGWGNHGTMVDPATGSPRFKVVQNRLTSASIELSCLAVTNRGQPGHPLYLPASAKPAPFRQSVVSSPARIS